MSRWKNEQHFVSWAGLTPNKDVSGGKVIRHRSKRVKNRVGNALRMAANSLHRSESYLGARFRKLKARRGAPKAIKGMARLAQELKAHYLGCLVHRILTHGQEWVDRGTREFEEKYRQRQINQLMRKAAELGIPLAAPNA
jgi:transposase